MTPAPVIVRTVADSAAVRTAPSDRPLHVRWLVRVRWASIGAQIAALLAVRFLLGAPFDVVPLAVVVLALAAANVVLARTVARAPSLSDAAIAGHLGIDVLALTLLLAGSGGPMNPFTTLYLLHVALAAVLLPGRWALGVTLLTVGLFAGLLLWRPEAIHIWHSARMFELHVRGMLLAFAATALAVWFFVSRAGESLARRERELVEAQWTAQRAQRLAAVGTLAAGAAHELNTPLGTVAILASELSELAGERDDLRTQAEQIRDQVRRCSEIVRRMRAFAPSGEEATREDLRAWTSRHVDLYAAGGGTEAAPVSLDVGGEEPLPVMLLEGTLRPALAAVLDNAVRAHREAGVTEPVRVRVCARNGDVVLEVRDRGGGIAESVRERLGEAFVTTREPGEGFGLGLFLASAAAAQHGGRLDVRAGDDGGTVVAFVLPRAA